MWFVVPFLIMGVILIPLLIMITIGEKNQKETEDKNKNKKQMFQEYWSAICEKEIGTKIIDKGKYILSSNILNLFYGSKYGNGLQCIVWIDKEKNLCFFPANTEAYLSLSGSDYKAIVKTIKIPLSDLSLNKVKEEEVKRDIIIPGSRVSNTGGNAAKGAVIGGVIGGSSGALVGAVIGSNTNSTKKTSATVSTFVDKRYDAYFTLKGRKDVSLIIYGVIVGSGSPMETFTKDFFKKLNDIGVIDIDIHSLNYGKLALSKDRLSVHELTNRLDDIK